MAAADAPFTSHHDLVRARTFTGDCIRASAPDPRLALAADSDPCGAVGEADLNGCRTASLTDALAADFKGGEVVDGDGAAAFLRAWPDSIE